MDGSWEWLQENAKEVRYIVVQSQSGRAKQMNMGAEIASQVNLLFLHADTRLPEINGVSSEIYKGCATNGWGRFDLRFAESDGFMRIVAFFINRRSRYSGIATGDQAIFVKASLFKKVGGYQDIPLMEDVALCKSLKVEIAPYCSRYKVVTSARRWLKRGRIKTVVFMWRLRWRYFLGESPEVLAKEYKNVR